ncbi:MAG: hypothetical protein GX207_07145 [Peptococcaceae bacterium]|nr:hypothetical protein [Peptococcaceae bacterium]
MPDLYLQDKLWRKLSDKDLHTFLQACDAKDIPYIQLDDVSWQLFPRLFKVTILLKLLTSNVEADEFAQKLKALLDRQGGNVILDRTSEHRSDLIDVLDMQIIMATCKDFAVLSDSCILHLYYSLKAKEKSMALIGGLTKQTDNDNHAFTYNITSYWKHLFCLRYYNTIHSPVPSILIEFENPDAMKTTMNSLAQKMVDSILCLYGRQYSTTEINIVKECWEKTNQSSPKKNPSHDSPSLNSSYSKLSLTSSKPSLTSALRRKQAKNNKPPKFKAFIPPGHSQINYFKRPKSSVMQPFYNQYYLNSQSGSHVVSKSTFQSNLPLNEKLSKNGLIATKEQSEKTFIESFKELEQLIEKNE